MHLQILSAILPEWIRPWLGLLAFGFYHGINPGMGWLFALSLGLQQKSEKTLWMALFPIALGHAFSIALIAGIILLGVQAFPIRKFQIFMASGLLVFGLYKIFNYYRHPKWVGMKVNMKDLFIWSFLMATAHGAGLMIAPMLISIIQMHEIIETTICGNIEGIKHVPQSVSMLLAIILHTFIMFVVMGLTAWLVYKKFGLIVLQKNWINFDLIWAFALFVVGGIALYVALN